MPAIRIELEDDDYWGLYSWAAREHRKAHEWAADLLIPLIRKQTEAREPEVAQAKPNGS